MECGHSVGAFTPEYERPGICRKGDACLSTEGVYCSRCVYYGKHRSAERFSRNAETDCVCRLLLEEKEIAWASRPRTVFFRFNDTPSTEASPLSLHDALPS